MQVVYMEVSVFGDKGIEELVHAVIENCLVLEKQLINYSLKEISKDRQTVTLKTFVQEETAGAPDITPLELKRQKKKTEGGCC